MKTKKIYYFYGVFTKSPLSFRFTATHHLKGSFFSQYPQTALYCCAASWCEVIESISHKYSPCLGCETCLTAHWTLENRRSIYVCNYVFMMANLRTINRHLALKAGFVSSLPTPYKDKGRVGVQHTYAIHFEYRFSWKGIKHLSSFCLHGSWERPQRDGFRGIRRKRITRKQLHVAVTNAPCCTYDGVKLLNTEHDKKTAHLCRYYCIQDVPHGLYGFLRRGGAPVCAAAAADAEAGARRARLAESRLRVCFTSERHEGVL